MLHGCMQMDNTKKVFCCEESKSQRKMEDSKVGNPIDKGEVCRMIITSSSTMKKRQIHFCLFYMFIDMFIDAAYRW